MSNECRENQIEYMEPRRRDYKKWELLPQCVMDNDMFYWVSVGLVVFQARNGSDSGWRKKR